MAFTVTPSGTACGARVSDDDLERVSLYFGEFAGVASLDGRPNVIELRRSADETSPIFGSIRVSKKES